MVNSDPGATGVLKRGGVQSSRWAAGILLALVAVALFYVEIPYDSALFGIREPSSLARVHIGFLFAIAVLYRDRLPLILALGAVYVIWSIKVSGMLPFTYVYYVFGIVSSTLTYLVLDIGSRWLRRGHDEDWRFSVADVPSFALFGMVLLPLLLTLLNLVLNLGLDPYATTATLASDATKVFFSTLFGVLILGLPLVVLCLSDVSGRPRTWWQMVPWRLLGLGVLLPAGLLQLAATAGWHVGVGLEVLVNSRLLVAAVLVWTVLRVDLRWSMPALVLVEFLFATSLAGYASQSTRWLDMAGLLRIAVECMMLELLVLLLLLYSRGREDALARHEQASLVEPLTRLPNLAAFRRYFETAHPQTLGFLLLDRTSKISAGLGLRAQAAMPRWVARQLADIAKTYHLGTGQLLLVLNPVQIDNDATWSVVLQRLHEGEFVWNGRRVRLLPYLGVAGTESPDETLDSRILRASDAAIDARLRGELSLQHAVGQGGQEPQERHQRVLQLSTTVLSRLREGEIELYLQPLAALSARVEQAGISGEILCRLRDSAGDLMLPGSFLPGLQRDRRMAELDLGVVRRIDRWLREERTADSPALGHLCINIAGQSLASRGFARELLVLLDQFPLPVSQLCFEVTETDAITHAGESQALFAALRERGCRISIDDFGVGYQSFERLKQIPVDVIKIDGSFVSAMMRSPRDLELVRAMVAVAHAFDAHTVAEYVQDAATVNALRDLSVDWGQGFHFARPLPITEALARWQSVHRQTQQNLIWHPRTETLAGTPNPP